MYYICIYDESTSLHQYPESAEIFDEDVYMTLPKSCNTSLYHTESYDEAVAFKDAYNKHLAIQPKNEITSLYSEIIDLHSHKDSQKYVWLLDNGVWTKIESAGFWWKVYIDKSQCKIFINALVPIGEVYEFLYETKDFEDAQDFVKLFKESKYISDVGYYIPPSNGDSLGNKFTYLNKEWKKLESERVEEGSYLKEIKDIFNLKHLSVEMKLTAIGDILKNVK